MYLITPVLARLPKNWSQTIHKISWVHETHSLQFLYRFEAQIHGFEAPLWIHTEPGSSNNVGCSQDTSIRHHALNWLGSHGWEPGPSPSHHRIKKWQEHHAFVSDRYSEGWLSNYPQWTDRWLVATNQAYSDSIRRKRLYTPFIQLHWIRKQPWHQPPNA